MALKVFFAEFVIALSLMTTVGSILMFLALLHILNVKKHYALYAGFLLGIICGLILTIVRLSPSFLSKILYYILSTYWGLLLYLFLFSLLSLAINAIHKLSKTVSLYIVVVPTILMFVCGFYNSHQLVIKHMSLKIPSAKSNVSIVHISDLHLGPIYGKKHVSRLVKEIKRLDPDFVMIAGDLFDGSMRLSPDVLSPFNDLRADIYLALGNHDDIFLGLEEVKRTLKESKIVLLKDEAVINRDINIIGISYRETNDFLVSKLKEMNLTDDKLNILIYHPPALHVDKFEEYNVHLHLGGHTHGGQLVPLFWDKLSPFIYIRGLYKSNSGKSYVHITEGIGTAGPYLRMFSRSTITLLNINP